MTERKRTAFAQTAKLTVCALLALLMLSAPLFARAEEEEKLAVDLLERAKGYTAVLYDNTNGLPTSEANAIAETEEGFLWIGSYGGLIRYDGKDFERFDSTKGISSVVSLFTDSKNRLWVGTNDSGIAVIDKGDLRIYNKADGLRSLFIRAFAEGHDGSIFAATTQGLFRIDAEMNLQPVDEPQINNEYISDLRIGVDDVIYGRTTDGAIFTMKDGNLTGFYDDVRLGIAGIHCFVPDKNEPGYAYIGTTQSEIFYGDLQKNTEHLQRISIAPLEYVNDIFQYKDEVWVCADNGIGVWLNGAFTVLESLPLDSSVECMMTDYQGNLWFASSKQGVMKIVPNRFSDLFQQYELPSDVVNGTCRYGDLLLVGRKKTGLAVIGENGVQESFPIKSARTASGEPIEADDLMELLRGGQIRSIIRDSRNRLWFSVYAQYALIRYENGVVTCFSMEDGLPSSRVRTVVELHDGTMAAACTGGLAIIDGNHVAEVFGEKDGIANTEVLTVAEGENGDLLLGTDGDGVYVISGNQVHHLGLDDGLASEVVMRIKKDRSRDLYWLVTSNSIAYMDAAYRVTTARQFPYSNNFDLYENSSGDMWVLSSNGIYVTPVEDLLANGEISAVLYNRHNGLPGIPTANAYSELTDDGELYIAGTTGVIKVNIDVNTEDAETVKMAVPYVEADGVLVYPDEAGKIVLSSDVRKLTIHARVFTYTLTNPQITYYLDGFDKTPVTQRRSELSSVGYTNLRGGDYRFVMQLKDSHGENSREYSVLIVKQKAFHEQLWFMILCAILLIAALAGLSLLYVRRKTRLLLAKQAEQKEIIKEITEVLAKTIDLKDKYTNGHSIRVAKYTAMLAKELGYDEESVEKYYNIALLHDIGKISVPPEVLNKNGKLDDEEYRVIQSHAVLGYETLKDIKIMPELAVGAGAHHERPDGKGYPNGLRGDEIPRVAQIIAVADTFDAMYSDRPYRKRMNFERIVSIMKEVSGTQLTPDVVDAFLRLVEKGKMRDPDDHGGGTTEDIVNIRKRFEDEEKE